MSELTFTKSFLTTLDTKPQKYASDHLFDRSTFTPRTPYVLPKLPHPPYPVPPQPDSTAPAPGSTPSTQTVTILLKTSRNPQLEINIADVVPSETSIAHLKETVRKELEAKHASTVDVSKIKILYNKKPIQPSKNLLSEAIPEEEMSSSGTTVELGIMIIGGLTATPSQAATPSAEAPTLDPMEGLRQEGSRSPAQGPHGPHLLETDGFWDDLQGFLEQRLKDEAEAIRLRGLFREAWKK